MVLIATRAVENYSTGEKCQAHCKGKLESRASWVVESCVLGRRSCVLGRSGGGELIGVARLDKLDDDVFAGVSLFEHQVLIVKIIVSQRQL